MDSIIEDFCAAWQTFDAEFIIKHLDDRFTYDSQWVFASLDYDGYKDYIRCKFKILKTSGNKIDVRIVEDTYCGGQMLALSQNGRQCYYRIEVNKRKVVKGDLCMF